MSDASEKGETMKFEFKSAETQDTRNWKDDNSFRPHLHGRKLRFDHAGARNTNDETLAGIPKSIFRRIMTTSASNFHRKRVNHAKYIRDSLMYETRVLSHFKRRNGRTELVVVGDCFPTLVLVKVLPPSKGSGRIDFPHKKMGVQRRKDDEKMELKEKRRMQPQIVEFAASLLRRL
ncbi:hypothetical protein CEXT_446791 [Caerostris extrusa]|uniref:Uncharacterized protein n=1 Tax=Caerostris extrusa TaxID=172846 RepID=A0AAV4SU02_CAEEX|nr:hypothetical protein CEXT_446791 [Caerostris extrusa]